MIAGSINLRHSIVPDSQEVKFLGLPLQTPNSSEMEPVVGRDRKKTVWGN